VTLWPRDSRSSTTSERKPDSMETCTEGAKGSALHSLLPSRIKTYVSWAELMVYPRLLHRVADVKAPVEVEQHLGDRAKDARAARSAESDVYLAFWAVHDQWCGRG
jgi:hypothetical protein